MKVNTSSPGQSRYCRVMVVLLFSISGYFTHIIELDEKDTLYSRPSSTRMLMTAYMDVFTACLE
jgi:hypothetical protein